MNELSKYDEDAAVDFILNFLPQELKEKFSGDTLIYILDLICEFYEKKDFMDDDDEETEEQELISFIVQQSKKNAIGIFLPDEILMVLRAEEAYWETLGDLGV